ncbi:hypothetical protein MRX96_020366 [Rhipicephalus microplus]
MQANVVFASCALLRLRKSTTDVTTSTHGSITVLPGLAKGGVSEYLTKEDSTIGLASEQIRQLRGHARKRCPVFDAGQAKETVFNCMQANVVFGSCALLRLRKSTIDVTTSTHGSITVLPELARGAFPNALQKKTAPLTGIRADPAAARARSITVSCF